MAPLPHLPHASLGEGESSGRIWFTADLKKPINFSIRTVCDRAVVEEEPQVDVVGLILLTAVVMMPPVRMI